MTRERFYREMEGLFKNETGEVLICSRSHDPPDYTDRIRATSGGSSRPMELFDGSDFAPITCAEHASSVVLAMRSKNRTLMMGGSTEQVLRRPDDNEVIGPPQTSKYENV